jgi:putative FmdB family regulatory protein
MVHLTRGPVCNRIKAQSFSLRKTIMPVYEYYCEHCDRRFEALRPMSQSTAPMTCPRCATPDARRLVSVFAAVSRDSGGSRLVAGSGSGGCGSCSGGSCATCGH